MLWTIFHSPLLPPSSSCLNESFSSRPQEQSWQGEHQRGTLKCFSGMNSLILCRSHSPTAIFYPEGEETKNKCWKKVLKKGESLKTLERWTVKYEVVVNWNEEKTNPRPLWVNHVIFVRFNYEASLSHWTSLGIGRERERLVRFEGQSVKEIFRRAFYFCSSFVAVEVFLCVSWAQRLILHPLSCASWSTRNPFLLITSVCIALHKAPH